MELIEVNSFSQLQKNVCEARLQDPPLTFDKIGDLFSSIKKLHHSTIEIILKRSALGFEWNPGESRGGQYPYLCPVDLEKLKTTAESELADEDGAVDIYEFLDTAREIKTERIRKGVKFLLKCKCQKLAQTIADNEPLEPSRSWVNAQLEELQISLKKPVYIDAARRDACSKQRLVSFYEKHSQLISETPPELILGADETMLSTTYRGKVLTFDEEPHQMLVRKAFKIPHITAMCAHTVSGVALPPFMIFPGAKKLPNELFDLKDSGAAWFSSSPSGWMTRDLFFVWCVHLINWLSLYRQTLASNIRDHRALLIIDGHTSRECPLGLLLLRNAKVDVLTLPGHSTHVTQMFDRVLASPLKHDYTKNLNKLLKENKIIRGETSQIGLARKLAVISFLAAWQKNCTVLNCAKAGKVCGFYPFDPHAIESNEFVKEFSAEEEEAYQQKLNERRRFDIGGKVITNSDVLNEIQKIVARCVKLSHLVNVIPNGWNYSTLVGQFVTHHLKNDCCFLGHLPPFVKRDGMIVQFPEPAD